ncbi:hypothetical protein ELT17_26630 (plasmid) [Escherichia coli]|nr:hypothetical protein ELX78_26920 [Escherichia coli]TFT20523.1 hypothetical protein ELT17_26630 [Escherichia coli]
MTDFGGKTSIFSHPVYLFLRKFSLQDSRGGSVNPFTIFPSEQPTTGDNQTLPVVCIHNPWH